MAVSLKNLASALARTKSAAAGIRDDIAKIRAEIMAAQVRRAEIEAAPVDSAEIERRVDTILNIAESTFADFWSDSWLSSPEFEQRRLNEKMESVFKSSPLGGFSYFGGRSLLRAAMIEEARAGMPVEAQPLSDEKRAQALAELDAEIRKLGILEEQVIRESATAGISISRREDADPAVFLRLDEELSK